MNRVPMVMVNVRVPVDIVERMKAAAEREGQSVSEWLREAVFYRLVQDNERRDTK